MANSIYCGKCYKSTSYTSMPGKFCSHCGASFLSEFESTSSASPKPAIKPPVRPRPVVEPEYEEDNQDYVEVPNISEIECEIEGRRTTENLSKVLGSNKGEVREVRKYNSKDKKLSKKQVENQFKKVLSQGNRENPTEIGG